MPATALPSAVRAAGTLSDYQFMRRHTGSSKRAEKAKEAWGASLNSLQDVCRVFTKYTSGEGASSLLAPCQGLAHSQTSAAQTGCGRASPELLQAHSKWLTGWHTISNLSSACFVALLGLSGMSMLVILYLTSL